MTQQQLEEQFAIFYSMQDIIRILASTENDSERNALNIAAKLVYDQWMSDTTVEQFVIADVIRTTITELKQG